MLFDLIRGGGGFTEIMSFLAAFLFALFTGLILHEWAHAFAAYKSGDDTAKSKGRLTLNPLAHLDPIGTVLLLIVGFGWAKPVPIDPRNFRNFRKGLLFTALAGVTVNLIMALVFTGIMHLVLHLTGVGFVSRSGGLYLTGVAEASDLVMFIIRTILFTIQINIVLLIFNLLPVFPLDGFRVLEAVGEGKGNIIDKYVQFGRRSGMFVTLAVILVLNLTGALGFIINGIMNLLLGV